MGNKRNMEKIKKDTDIQSLIVGKIYSLYNRQVLVIRCPICKIIFLRNAKKGTRTGIRGRIQLSTRPHNAKYCGPKCSYVMRERQNKENSRKKGKLYKLLNV